MTETLIVTGIGSRKIDAAMFQRLYRIARRMAEKGWILRSGGAIGADTAWERGWDGFDRKEIFKVNGKNHGTYENFVNRPDCYHPAICGHIWQQAVDRAQSIHPAWERLDEYSQALHTRNVFQILGLSLDHKTDVVAACAEPSGLSVKGGTATAYNLARGLGIPTFNLWTRKGQVDFFAFVLERMGMKDESQYLLQRSNSIKTPDNLSEFFDFQ